MIKKTLTILTIICLSLLTTINTFADDFTAADEEENSTNSYILDADNTGGDITLQFGTILNKQIKWDATNLRFDINDNTYINGQVDIANNLIVEQNISQNGLNFTLDADNTGTGQDVTITANQGTDPAGTIRYNSTSNQWEYSDDGGSYTAFAAGSPIRPYLSGNTDIILFDNTTGDITITGDNLDDLLTIDLGPQVTINSITAVNPTEITINYTTGATLQSATAISIKRGSISSYGDNLTCTVTDVVIGTGSAGTFTTDFNSGTDSAAWGSDWALAIFGGINSLDGYFQTQAYNTGTPSSGTGPDTSDVFGNGSGQYMYSEVSSPNYGNGKYGTATTSNFHDLTQIDFNYHMAGNNFGDFSLWSQNGDNTWTQRWLVNRAQQSNQGDPAINISLNTSTWDCKTIEFRFAAPTNNSGYSADIAIDDIVLTSV